MSMKRAYSVLNIKAADDSGEERIITGIATTPVPDRVGDIVEPLGVKYKNPLPLLWQHRHDQPVGTVRFDKPTKDGVSFTAKMPKVTEPGPLKDRVDTAWGEVKHGLVRAVSIGFRELEYSRMDDGGYRFIESEVLELSLVTIPANQEATILSIKTFDAAARAASGNSRSTKKLPGVTGTVIHKQVKAQEATDMKKTIAQQIAEFQATREQKAADMVALMEKASDNGETLSAEDQATYDSLEADVESVDAHIKRLEKMDKMNVTKAAAAPAPGDAAPGDDASASRARKGVTVTNIKRNLIPGAAFTRFAVALAKAKGNRMEALEIIQSNKDWMDQTPEVAISMKAAVAAGTTTDSTWAAPLVQYQDMSSEFIDYLRPRTIIGRIPGLRTVPFKIRVPRQTAVAAVNWVGENKPKPVSKGAFDTITLDHFKIAGIIALTEELVRFSSPSAEQLARDDLAGGIIQLMDNDFIDPLKGPVANVSPASITYGVTPITASGTAYSNLKTDVKNAMQGFLNANMSPEGVVVLMRHDTALSLSLMETSLGQAQFPGLNMNGGTFLGMPVITSDNIPFTEESPGEGGLIIFVKANEIMLADDGQITVDVSREASVQMNDTPDDPVSASTVMVSFWQQNLVGIRAERMINWAKRRSAAVQMIQTVKYA